MRSLAVITTFALLVALPAVTGELKGTVIENKVGGSPAADVEVTALGANPYTTKADGQFKLLFPDKNPGSKVYVAVRKRGYVVVNDIQLEQVLSIHPDDKLLVILISKPSISSQKG